MSNPSSVIITEAVTQALQSANRASMVINGDSVVDGLVDVLALFVAQSPYAAGERGKREYIENIAAGLKTRVNLIRNAQAERRTGLVIPRVQ